MKKEKLKSKVWLVFLILPLIIFIFACAEIYEKTIAVPAVPGATYVGDETCLGCHEDAHPDLMAAYKHSIHAAIADFETFGIKKGCESCHGPGSVHSEEGDPASIINLKKLDADQASAICLRCHTTGGPMKWRGGEHALHGVTCIDCHHMHQARKVADEEAKAPTSAWERHVIRPHALAKAEPELCYECHREIQTRLNYTSHHPIREGKMVCTDCHEAHGGPRNLKTDERTINDVCFVCHPQYQGPFAYEHEAVVEGCEICHEPHGTVVNNLLKKAEPFVCLQCHHIHTDVKIREVAGSRCIYCHPDIHGSNVRPYLGLK